tara:strand:+ start:151 stop:741 length:591 start_codon:yes stop_codon:yes gene_type:complete
MIFTISVYSQSFKGVTEEGKKVILYGDGTWKYDVEVSKSNNSKLSEMGPKNISFNDLSDCKYWKDEIDDFTGKVKKYTKSKNIGNGNMGRLYIELRRHDNRYLIYVRYSGDLGCVSSDSEIMIKLLNKEIITLYNYGDIDCGDMNMYFRLSITTMDKLLKSPIEKIRVEGTEYYSDIDRIKIPNYFIDNFKCIEIK